MFKDRPFFNVVMKNLQPPKVILSSCTKLPLFICLSPAHNALIHACNYEITTKLGLAHRALCPHPTTAGACLSPASTFVAAPENKRIWHETTYSLRLPLPDVRIIST